MEEVLPGSRQIGVKPLPGSEDFNGVQPGETPAQENTLYGTTTHTIFMSVDI